MATIDPTSTRRRLALAIVDFLNTSLTDGTLPPDDKDSIEVATSCIADSFKIDPTDTAAVAGALGASQNLLSIYTVYEKLRGKSTTSTDGLSSAQEARPSTPSMSGAAKPVHVPNATKNADAEGLKGQGNVAMQEKNYASAIELYSRAISMTPTNPIYLSNRAAAYSATQQHELAKQDAEMAVAADPMYTKAWSRLGLARFALGDPKGSLEAYKSGIDAEGNGGSDAMKRGYETARRKVQELDGHDDIVSPERSTNSPGSTGPGMPDLSSLASMFGGGGTGSMPDLSQLMNNPMMREMAQSVMQNPEMMQGLMNNPRLREMAGQLGGGAGSAGSGPDLASIMNDPNIAEMARNFMGGAGRGGGA